jgi:UDPglucose--hexose-1-phosphate uridylyltransferase
MENNWERRWHPLLQEWVILAATTANRPWSGETLDKSENGEPDFDPACYLCPGVTRASGIKNPDYEKPYVFTNDFASFSMDAPDIHVNQGFKHAEPVHGSCRVICFSKKHNSTLAELTLEEINQVFEVWHTEFSSLSKHPKIENVLMFENKGKVIGVSNPHPHGQIYATGFVPKYVEMQRKSFAEYYKKHGSHLLEDILGKELSYQQRIIEVNDHFVAFVPYFARFVFETYIVPKKHVAFIDQLDNEKLDALACIFKNTMVRFDNLFDTSFPNITMHQNGPTDGKEESSLFHYHIEFYPPMRSPDKLKYLAGFESGGGNIINPVKPEEAAAQLRNASIVHYKNQ